MRKNNGVTAKQGSFGSSAFMHCEHWSALLDHVCEKSGNDDTYKLAHLICEESGKSSGKEIEAVARNIINWRNGSHVPTRKNFRILTDVLEISNDENLLSKWNELYVAARKRNNSAGKVHNNQVQIAIQATRNSGNRTLVLAIAFGLAAILAAFAIYPLSANYFLQTEVAPDWHANNISWRRDVTLKVGDEAVVHGHRGKCGQMPPEPQVTEDRFARLETGSLKVGELGMRYSRQCNGTTPAREVIFHAERPGSETFVIFDDDVTVTVSE